MKEAKEVMLDNPAMIFDAEDRPVEIVDCPEWGTKVRVRGMTVAQRLEFSDAIPRSTTKVDKEGNPEVDYAMLKPTLLVFCIVGANGLPLFNMKDMPKLSQRSVAVIDRLYSVAERLCGMGKEQATAIRKN